MIITAKNQKEEYCECLPAQTPFELELSLPLPSLLPLPLVLLLLLIVSGPS